MRRALLASPLTHRRQSNIGDWTINLARHRGARSSCSDRLGAVRETAQAAGADHF
jgi:hypothetical protein